MGADKFAQNTPNAPNAQIVCSSPKVRDFDEKRLHWASVVRDCNYGIDGKLMKCFRTVDAVKKFLIGTK